MRANPESESRPTASLEALKQRAEILATAREFFRARDVLEVETPVLCAAGAVDVHLEPIPIRGGSQPLYLVTSPEHSMKRLLAAGSGPIYQITRAFRDGERGRLHNPEFTILEWYRPGWDHVALMEEVEELTKALLPHVVDRAEPFERLTYRAAFERTLGIDPHRASLQELERAARDAGGPGAPAPDNHPAASRDAWLDQLLVSGVEPTLGVARPTFLFDYPASQCALARIRPGDPPVAERFELYVRGLELANGYHELLDADEQARRFEEANLERTRRGRVALPLDARFLQALRAGMPACAGVAVGIDRLVMLATGAQSIDEVLAFPSERA